MISERDARERIVESVQMVPVRRVSLADALGCFAAQDYFANIPLPAFDNSAMDGYAVIAADCKHGNQLRVVDEQPAGVDRRLRINNGEAVRVFTGAPIPARADSVVMQEDVTHQGDHILVNAEVKAGEFVRLRGCDLAEGQRILSKGEKIRTTTIGLLASQGISDLAIGGEVSASIISTGDELVRPGVKLQPSQIYDSNSALLRSLCRKSGAAVRQVVHCNDDRASLDRTIGDASKTDVLIFSGGVSVGAYDLVQSTLSSLGAKIAIWRVAIKPGKPFLFGQIGSCSVFGLPGNPVSAFVTFLQFVRPAILKMMGATNLELPKVPAKLKVDLKNDSDRANYFRGKLENGAFAPVGRQESHALFGLSQSNALLRLPAGGSAKNGAIVDVEVWDE